MARPTAGKGALRVPPYGDADREAVRRILKQHHAVGEFRDEPFSDAKFDRHVEAYLRQPPRRLGLVVERAVLRQAQDKGDSAQEEGDSAQGRSDWSVVGVALAGADPTMLSDGPLFVNVQIIAVELERLGPAGRARAFLALANALKLWARAIKASRVFVHVTTGYKPEATGRLMQVAEERGFGFG